MAVESYTKEFQFGKSSGDRHILQLIRKRSAASKTNPTVNAPIAGSDIQPKRLEAVPWALLCIQCQGLQEKGLLEI